MGGARLAVFCARHPLFAVALPTVAAAMVAARHPWLATGLVAGFSGAAALGGHWRRAALVGLLGIAATASITWRNHRRDEAEPLLLAAGQTEAAGKVLADARRMGAGWVAPVRLAGGPWPGARVEWQGRGEPPCQGARVSAAGCFQPLPTARNPGAFDKAAYLRRQGIAAVFYNNRGETAVTTGRLAALSWRVRAGFRAAVTDGLDPASIAAMTIRAVVIGEYPPDGDALVSAFRNSGTLHIFSVSGMHVAMVAVIGGFAMFLLGVPRRAAAPVLLIAVFGYCWLTGSSPPAVRAAWMAAVFIGAFVWRRQPDLLNALGLVLLVAALWDGNLLFQPGVQLSYGVVAAIALGAGVARRAFAWIAAPEPYVPESLYTRRQRLGLEFRRRAASSLGASTAATVGSFPLTAWHFGMVTPVSIIATPVLAVPVFVMLALALASAAIHPALPRGSVWINRANGIVANCCVGAASLMAKVPGGCMDLRRGGGNDMLVVYDLDYGAGAAALRTAGGGAALFDCGDHYSFRSEIVPSLRRLGIVPGSVVLSHPDGMHLGGAGPVWTAFPIRRALLPVRHSISRSYQGWVRDAPTAGVETVQAGTAVEFGIGTAAVEILYVPPEEPYTRLADERVAVCRLHWRGWRILFMADAGFHAEKALLGSGKDISADVIVAGRHIRDLSLTDAFVRRVGPRAIIASNRDYPAEQRRDPAQMDFWRKLGIEVFDQEKTGGVTLCPASSGKLAIEGFLNGQRVELSQ